MTATDLIDHWVMSYKFTHPGEELPEFRIPRAVFEAYRAERLAVRRHHNIVFPLHPTPPSELLEIELATWLEGPLKSKLSPMPEEENSDFPAECLTA